ncbi:hypothetical protein ACFQ9Y_19885 [Peribacillus simplex]|uniref:hypothetical protein n=1 Tax=Peribacillus simplex TaxID=1478 RepID=UPI00366F3A33
MLSSGVVVRLADPHLVYDGTTRKRINRTKSVYLGDHIWIGQDVMILKGVEVGTGSILGAMSLVTKIVPIKCISCRKFCTCGAEKCFLGGPKKVTLWLLQS